MIARTKRYACVWGVVMTTLLAALIDYLVGCATRRLVDRFRLSDGASPLSVDSPNG
jgi:hypothetical protein